MSFLIVFTKAVFGLFYRLKKLSDIATKCLLKTKLVAELALNHLSLSVSIPYLQADLGYYHSPSGPIPFFLPRLKFQGETWPPSLSQPI